MSDFYSFFFSTNKFSELCVILFQDEEVGVPYQDIKSEAAVLVTHDPHDESLILVSTVT